MNTKEKLLDLDFDFLKTDVPKWLIIVNVLLVLVYLYTIIFILTIDNIYLFILLMSGQLFYAWLGFAHMYTLWDMNVMPKLPKRAREQEPSVNVFITVAGEPVDVIEETARAAKSMEYRNFNVYLLNDGYVANKDNWKEIEWLAEDLGIRCITRRTPGGAKAGNINNALEQTNGELVVIFDADHIPYPDFLKKTVPYFHDRTVGFVQSPQYYKNYEANRVTEGSWDQQRLYYGAICKGKNRHFATTMCGTNMVIRRTALEEVGGMCSTNIAEDFITGMFIHERGWKSIYVPEVLAEGLAPEDFRSYWKQQHRWARGSLEVFFFANPLFRKGLTLPQKIQYLSSSSYYLSGLFVLTNGIMPIIYFFTGESLFTTATMVIAAVFLPYIFLTLYNLQRSSSFTYTFRAIAFSMGSFPIYISALADTIFGLKQSFSITSKKRIKGSFAYLVIPHLLYIILAISGMGYALFQEGFTPSFITNATWAILNIAIFSIFVQVAFAPDHAVAPAGQRAPYQVLRPSYAYELKSAAHNQKSNI